MSIFSKLKLSKSPKDLASSIDAIDTDILSCQAEIKKLEDGLDRALFDEGEAAIAKLQKDLMGKREHLDLLQRARRGAVSRQAEAEAEERRRELETTARRAQVEIVKPMATLYQNIHANVVALIANIQEVERLDGEARRINDDLSARGRNDLMLELPYLQASQAFKRFGIENGFIKLISEAWEDRAKEVGFDNLPDDAFMSTVKPISAPQLRELSIPGYIERGSLRWEQPYRFF